MPVYIRKNVSYTPPSIYNIQLEDDNDYLLDPDQLRDILPQPYRMINKILVQLLDNVWEIVEGKENTILAEARKVRPPRLEEPEELPVFNNATALKESVDGKYIFVGLPNGLAVMETQTQTQLHAWEEEHAEITDIKTYLISPDWHLIVTVDDMAISRLFLFAFNHIFFVKALNENSPEATSKILCQKCEASKDGDYAGLVLENTGSKEVWFEVHKLPVEGWQKELESIAAAISKQKEENEKILAENVEDPPEQVEGQPPPEQPPQESPRAPVPESTVIEQLGVKFSQPSVILKVKPPHKLPLPPNGSSSVASAISKVDTGDVLGVGTNHVLSSAHLESRDVMFKHRHDSMLKYLPEEKEDFTLSATFHFVNVSRMLTFGLENNTPEFRPVAVMVWWSGSPHLSQYSLLKAAGKDIEFKADIVWPFTSNITCSAVSPCTTHLALGLENGNLVLWDRQLGLDKAVLTVSDKSALRSVRFLDPCLFPMDQPHYPPYPVSSATFLLTECCDGSQALFDTCDGSQQIPRCIATEPENDDDIQTLLKVIPELPELIIYVQKNGSLYIKDIGTGAALCQVVLPPTHSLQSPWEPIFALGGGGNFLFVKAEGTEETEEGEANDISCLFMYNLKSYRELEPYWSREHQKKDLAVYTDLDSRISSLMQERLQQQALRKPHMQNRWGQLRSELSMIQQAHAVPLDSLRITAPSSIHSSHEEIHFKTTKASVL
ncbi:WD repeat-containing protein 93 isoform X2 [Aplysia californica]|uniref:WD repeat-containing protein 93 isoform X2 n=1 Tax=Aplysia californica TaxID=6500 RepID=A0ABM0JAB5_APLCA|nr:WD repeat-containing protein 93 isoform X2 [Aplysia californica]